MSGVLDGDVRVEIELHPRPVRAEWAGDFHILPALVLLVLVKSRLVLVAPSAKFAEVVLGGGSAWNKKPVMTRTGPRSARLDGGLVLISFMTNRALIVLDGEN